MDDKYAEQEMTRHLSDRYGEIKDLFFINYDVEKILTKIGMGARADEQAILEFKTPIQEELED